MGSFACGSSARLGALSLGLALAAACTLNPNIPNARVLCLTSADCPSGFVCEKIEQAAADVRVCCKQAGCTQSLTPQERNTIEQARKDAAVDLPGADASSDADAGAPGCGNGRIEQGETCDPPASCPTSCPQRGCETYTLQGSAATCTALCVQTGTEAQCKAGDQCCPPGCDLGNDSDCACTCGNGMVEGACGETCDPLSGCPRSCPQMGCMLRRLANPGTCHDECVDDRPQTTCLSGDGCCPSGCNAGNDSDCQPACGNGVVEVGETCDPSGSCPTSCPPIGCTRRKLQGTAATCTAKCVDDTPQTACASGDGCCPAGCNAGNDSDCACTCGNGVVESACQETCDPLSSCPTGCPAVGCQLRRLVNGNTCQAQCVDNGMQTACVPGDGCCPAACNANNDSDCAPKCGNGVVEAGETCDPASSCPSTCPWNGCMRKRLSGSSAACTAQCVDDGTQTACAHGDGCCPSTCNSVNDNDCMPRCGNGVVEAGETCDGNCPTSCPPVGCQRRRLQGTAAGCTAQCVNDTLITTCGNGDACCPSGCTTVNDNDCSCQCGNGVVETACGEKCDGNCPTSCPPVGCQLRTLQGTAAACSAQCANAGTITACANGDSCCPSACNANNDNNCTPVCGNGVVEAGETCDPSSACQTQSDACVSDANTVRTRAGSVSSCTFQCTTAPRPCSATSDTFCPSACTPCGASCGIGQDIDCKLANGSPCTSDNECPGACADGRCCAASCGVCQACTGAGGTCVNIALGGKDTVPAGTCSGVKSCDGNGVCKLDNGQSCPGGAASCTFGLCVDGVCCNAVCGAQCDRCDLFASLGTCTTLGLGSTPSPLCGNYACNGSTSACPPSNCSSNDNCILGTTCQQGSCQTCRMNGATCSGDVQCCSGDCFNFACQ